jgi:3-oxoacyl-[acyl-carrier-protein] synthase II
MAASSRRAVISGIGALNALGPNTAAVWNAVLEGQCGIRPITLFDASGLPVRIAAEMAEFDAKKYIPKEDKEARKSLRMMARAIELAVAASNLALADGAVDKSKLDRTRFGCEFGSGLIAMELKDVGDAALLCTNGTPGKVDMKRWGREGLESIEPLWMLKYLPNMLACHVSILHDAQGPNNSITESDVASLLALGEAHRILERDGADLFLVGGAESKVNPLSMVRQCLFEPLSHRNEEPARACRPFDRKRDGLVLGEGGTVMVVEELEHAKKRGARIYAEVIGFGAAFDARKSGSGIARAIRAALSQAGITPQDLDHINAHGLGSIDSDAWEARGLHEVFGSCSPAIPVIALKSAIGNMGAGAGLTELAISILGQYHGRMPSTLNYEEPDPACPVTVQTGAPRPVRSPYALKIGFTQMGQCAAVVVRKFEQ